MASLIIDTPTFKKYRDSVLEYVEFFQGTPDDRWEIQHDLGRWVAKTTTVIVDGIVGAVEPRIVDVNRDRVVVIFGQNYTGKATVK